MQTALQQLFSNRESDGVRFADLSIGTNPLRFGEKASATFAGNLYLKLFRGSPLAQQLQCFFQNEMVVAPGAGINPFSYLQALYGGAQSFLGIDLHHAKALAKELGDSAVRDITYKEVNKFMFDKDWSQLHS